jgi:hypothetical protein
MLQRVETAKLVEEQRRLCGMVEDLLGRYRAARPASSSIRGAPILRIRDEKRDGRMPVLVGRIRISGKEERGGDGDEGKEDAQTIPVRVGYHHLQLLASRLVPAVMQ